jgi:hypothetical protein
VAKFILARPASALLLTLATASQAAAQAGPKAPAYQELRYDEDWSYLKDGSRRSDIWDGWKYISLGREGWYTSIGGESRIRLDFFRSAGFGSVPDSPNGFLLQRYLLHSDTHFGPHLRIFVQAQSGLETGRVGGPRPTDRDVLEVHQGFADFSTSADPKKAVTLRLGRQEFEFGAGRYLATAEVFNVRRSFDGARIFAPLGAWTWNALAAKPVQTNPEMFDDSPEHRQSLWATGFYGPHPILRGGNLSFYYLGFDRKDARFDRGAGREIRHTGGSRSWGKWRNFDYNYELLFQWGSFAGNSIRAWALSTETGYTRAALRFAPRFSLRGNVASGDQNRSLSGLHSFNPLFPSTAYSGKIGLIGPINVMDVSPNVRLRLHRRVYFLPESSFFWRESLDEGIYNVLGQLQRTGRLSQARYIGTQFTAPVQWMIDRHLTYTALISRFLAGQFLKETPPGKSVTYFSAFLTYRF